jgi:hypothetical protein
MMALISMFSLNTESGPVLVGSSLLLASRTPSRSMRDVMTLFIFLTPGFVAAFSCRPARQMDSRRPASD